MTSNALYHTFDTDASPSLSDVGGKALSLIRSTGSGLPVPPGFVLTTAFFGPWLDEVRSTSEWVAFLGDGSAPTREVCDALKAKCRGLSLARSQRDGLDDALRAAFGDGGDGDGSGGDGDGPGGSRRRRPPLFAVRSSSPEEDLVGASFAGGYDTTLGVTEPGIEGAIVVSFASMLDHRVVQYKIQNGIPIDSPRIAVAVQRQIASSVSGVGFSLNPQNNCHDEAVISANFGLGETVVGGLVTPDTYVVDRVAGKILSKRVPDKALRHVLDGKGGGGGVREERNDAPGAQALNDEQILRVSDLIYEVEGRMGRPVDVEWAVDVEGALHLLQARPVTSYVPLFPEMMTAPGEQKILYLDGIVMTQGFSDPMSVLGMDIWAKLVEVCKPHITHGKDGLVWEVHGREYMNMSHMLRTFGGQSMCKKMFDQFDRPTRRVFETYDMKEYTPDEVPEKSRRMLWDSLKQVFRLFPAMVRGMWDSERCLGEYLKIADEIVKECRDGEKGTAIAVSGGSFAKEVDRLMLSSFGRLVPACGALIMPLISYWRLKNIFSDHKDMQDLLVALNMDLEGNPTSEMGHRMVQLAAFPEIQDCPSGEEFVRRLKGGEFSAEFSGEYDAFIEKFGCRGMKEIDIASPRGYERPDRLFDRIKRIDAEDNAIRTVKERREAAFAKLLDCATRMGKEKSLRRHADYIRKLGGYREHPKYIYVVVVAHLRRRALELGTKFAKEGRLERADQIFDLSLEDISSADVGSVDLLNLIKKNRAAYDEVRHVKDWPLIIDSRGKILRAPRENVTDGNHLGGDPISPGVVKGRAKVLSGPYEKPLERGEVLVTRMTEPSWTPIFVNAAAVVLEVGGPLQHGAVIAREYGIPCVSGVEHATKVIRDGDLLEIDGTEGIVRFLDKKVEAEK